jgi:hypothetical protein
VIDIRGHHNARRRGKNVLPASSVTASGDAITASTPEYFSFLCATLRYPQAKSNCNFDILNRLLLFYSWAKVGENSDAQAATKNSAGLKGLG